MGRLKLAIVALLLLAGATGCNGDDDGTGVIAPFIDQPTALADFDWSPDGSTIAVGWSGPPEYRRNGIYLVDTGDWSIRELIASPDSNILSTFSSPAWSPDGEWLAFSHAAQLYKIKANGDSLTQLTFTSRQHSCDWSDSDSMIVYSISIGDSGGIWIMHSDGSNNRQLIGGGGHVSFGLADSVLFVGWVRPGNQFGMISLMNPFDSTFREVYRWEQGNPYHLYYEPRLSTDGAMIVLSIQANVWTMTSEGTELKQLTSEGGWYPNWSPDGKRIVYVVPSQEGGTFWIMNADGSDKVQIPGW